MTSSRMPHRATRMSRTNCSGGNAASAASNLSTSACPHTARRHHRPAFHLGGEPEGRPIGPDHLDRMRVEGDDDTGASCRFRASRRLAEHGVVSAMHSVEGADGDGGALGAEAEFTHVEHHHRLQLFIDRHRRPPTNSPPCTSATVPSTPSGRGMARPWATWARAASSSSTRGMWPSTASGGFTAAASMASSGSASLTDSAPIVSRRSATRCAPSPSFSPTSRAKALT